MVNFGKIHVSYYQIMSDQSFFFASRGPLAHLGTPQRPGKIAGFQRHLAPRGKDELETKIMGFHQQRVVSNYQQKLGMLCFLLT